MTTDDLVNVLVPRKHLSQVYGLIAQLEHTASGTVPFDDGGRSAIGNAPDEWTPSRLRRMVQESGPAMRDLLREMATRPGDWLSTQDLAAAIKDNSEADWKTIAGTLGAFSRRLKSRYGIETWPFQFKRDHKADAWIYSMPGDMAAKILPLLDGDL